MRDGFDRRVVLGGLAASALTPAIAATDKWKALGEDVRTQMAWAWAAYKDRCFGADQIKPVSGGSEAFFFPKGPPMGLSIVEALDTLYVMGLDKEVEDGVRWIADNLHFDIDGEVQVFETGIRVVGGLLSGWCGTRDKKLLALAKDLADRLSPAFTKSPTGMPYRFVNLKTGTVRDPESYPAEIGTYIAEWGTLSRATGDQKYFDMAKRAMKALFDRRSKIDLVADTIDIETGAMEKPPRQHRPADGFLFRISLGWLAALRRCRFQALVRHAHRRHRQISGDDSGRIVCGFRRSISRPAQCSIITRANLRRSMRGFWRKAAIARGARPIWPPGPTCRRNTACCRKAMISKNPRRIA